MTFLAIPGWLKALLTLTAAAAATLIALGFHALGVTDAGIVLTLLMGVVLCSWAFGVIWSLLSSLLAVGAHAYFFSVPLFSFEVSNPQHGVAFLFLAAIGLVVASLSARLRDQVGRLEALGQLSQALSRQIDHEKILGISETHLSFTLKRPITIRPAQPVPEQPGAIRLAGGLGTLGWAIDGPGCSFPRRWDRRAWLEALLAPVSQALERAELVQAERTRTNDLEATRVRNTILHSISHDLRTPLTVVSTTAWTLLEKTPERDERHADLLTLHQEILAIIRQVEGLLDLTSLHTGAVQPRREWVPLEELVDSCLERIYQRSPQLTVTCHLPPETLIHVDETLMTRALSNLLENAAQYAPGPVEITVLTREDTVQIEVADRGPGIVPEERDAIFGLFVRGQGGHSQPGHRGTGVGLALVAVVAALHGGAAGVSPREGGGSRFWLRWRQEHRPVLWEAPQ